MSIAISLVSAPVYAAEHNIEEVIVTGPFHETVTESALPVGLLSGEELRKDVANSLGDTLDGQPGVHSSSFGPGVGQPVLRGQSGKRVQVLQNSVFVADAANLSPDHANGIEPLLADSIEVVRGPATLLYGSGAIGGVINVLDQKIPTRLFESPELVLEQSHSSVSDENKTVFGLSASSGSFAFHADAYTRKNGNVDIKGFAVDEAAIEALEELAGEMHEEEEEEEEEAVEGYIENSNGKANGGSVGFSFIQDNGFIGFSYNRLESEYGLPPGVHGHHHEEEEDPNAVPGAPVEEEEEEDVTIRLNMVQDRYDIKSDYHFDSGFFEEARFHLGYTDYEHSELEIEDGVVEVGTRFINDGFDGRFALTTREQNGWQGVWGVQLNSTDFSAIGEEAFIPATEISNAAIFVVERLEMEEQTLEFGGRLERAELEPASCGTSDTVFSLSASLIRDISEDSVLTVGLGRSERAPTVEERFSNISTTSCGTVTELVTHAATNLIEVGNPNLSSEVSNNLDVGYRFSMGSADATVSAFYNDVSDYVFLNLTGQELDETQVANYESQDATFYGLEATLDFPILDGRFVAVNGSVFADFVRGEFDNGSGVPRMPPARMGVELTWSNENWTADVELARVFHQDQTATIELPTQGYTLVNAYSDYHWDIADQAELTLFARLDNLTNQEIRNHVSFLKNVAPEAGRSVRIGLRLRY